LGKKKVEERFISKLQQKSPTMVVSLLSAIGRGQAARQVGQTAAKQQKV